MNADELEKLSELKDKGVITQEEFEIQKEKILKGDVTNNTTNWVKNVVGIIGLIVVILGVYLSSQEMDFACDENSMKQAQDLINENFPNWNGVLRLSNPQIDKQTENTLLCKVNTNFDKLPVINYKLNKQEDGSILIEVNPMFVCDENTMKQAQDLINESFPNWHGTLRLSNPEMDKQTEKSLICKVNTNFDELPVLHYKLNKQEDGSFIIEVNPMEEILTDSIDEWENL